MDRDRARDLRLLAARPLPRRGVPVRRVVRGSSLGAPGARLHGDSRASERAPVRHDYRRPRRGLDELCAAPRWRAWGPRHPVRARRALMDVLSPRSLDEALRLKAENPDARFVQGGTDVLVEL